MRRAAPTRNADIRGLVASSASLGRASEAVTAAHYQAKAPEAADMKAVLADFFRDVEG